MENETKPPRYYALKLTATGESTSPLRVEVVGSDWPDLRPPSRWQRFKAWLRRAVRR